MGRMCAHQLWATTGGETESGELTVPAKAWASRPLRHTCSPRQAGPAGTTLIRVLVTGTAGAIHLPGDLGQLRQRRLRWPL